MSHIFSSFAIPQEKSFRECILSWFFLWHLLWLSAIQLRHYFFIGTLNPMLQHLTGGEPSLGKDAQHDASSLKNLANIDLCVIR